MDRDSPEFQWKLSHQRKWSKPNRQTHSNSSEPHQTAYDMESHGTIYVRGKVWLVVSWNLKLQVSIPLHSRFIQKLVSVELHADLSSSQSFLLEPCASTVRKPTQRYKIMTFIIIRSPALKLCLLNHNNAILMPASVCGQLAGDHGN